MALRVLGRRRRDLLAIYGFARLADELGDEAPGDRLALLDALEEDLARAYRGEARHGLLRRLEPTLRERGLPPEPFLRLIQANRRDQRVQRTATFEELLDYCALSANPVGELVLRVFDAASPRNLALSDSVCSALQVVEHLQDVCEDRARGRVYLPAEDLERFGCRDEQLLAVPTPPALRGLLAFEAARARTLLRDGEPLVARLRGGARLAVAGFVAGGHAALDALARADHEVASAPRRPRRRDLAFRALQLLWRARVRGARG